MTKFRLKGHSVSEIEDKIVKSVSLEKDEKFLIKVIKEPRNFLFIKFQGEYEVSIVKKENLKPLKKENRKKIDKKNIEIKEIKENKKEKNQKKVEKIEKIEKIEKVEKVENFEKTEETKKEDNSTKRLMILVKEFIAHSNLDITVKAIELKNQIYKVELEGNDIRYLIGERGIGISSLEYIMMSFPEFKNMKIYFDSNNFKEKREQILKELAIRTAKQVLKTNKKMKLNPMPSRERRIIHEEISKIEGLETVSVGQEPKRYLVIKPKNIK